MSRVLLACLLALAVAGSLRAQDVPLPFPPKDGFPEFPPPPKKVEVPTPPPQLFPAPVVTTPLPPGPPMPPPIPSGPPVTVETRDVWRQGDSPFGFTEPTFNQYRIWGGADYSMWWFRNAPIAVPLAVSTTSAPGPNANVIGRDPNVRIVLGPDQIDQGARNGGRAWLGFWFDDARSLGFEVTGTLIESPNERVTVQSNGAVILSRPIVMPNGTNGVYDIGYPGIARGSFTMQNRQQLQGLEANFLGFAVGNHEVALDLLAGARYLNLEEQIDLNYQVTNLTPMPAFGNSVLAAGTNIQAIDSYRARNQFYGGQIGGRLESNFGRLSVALAGKVAFGVNDMSLDVTGYTTRSDAATVYQGGVLANAANIGRYRESHYAFVPEGNLTVGWWFTPNVRLKVGYNVLYISDVVRPGSRISNAVNPAAVPVDQTYGTAPVTRTSPFFQRSDFWADGISLGIDIRY